jgi:protein-S-isoprenylcysteine O-methyltransferase Ste14
MKVEAEPHTGHNITDLIGSGHLIMLLVAPFLVVGLVANIAAPSVFAVGGPPGWLRTLSIGLLAIGVVIWLWSVVLVLVKVPRGELITAGPFALMRHPIYAGVSLLVLPWLGFLLDTWLGLALGLTMYLATRRFAPREEDALARMFGPDWEEYRAKVKFPWL